MVGISSLKRPKVALTVYVQLEVKHGLKIAATLERTTTSNLVEVLCKSYLDEYPAVQKALREGK